MLKIIAPPRDRYFRYSISIRDIIKLICPSCGCEQIVHGCTMLSCKYCNTKLPNLIGLANSEDLRKKYHFGQAE